MQYVFLDSLVVIKEPSPPVAFQLHPGAYAHVASSLARGGVCSKVHHLVSKANTRYIFPLPSRASAAVAADARDARDAPRFCCSTTHIGEFGAERKLGSRRQVRVSIKCNAHISALFFFCWSVVRLRWNFVIAIVYVCECVCGEDMNCVR